MRNSRIWKHFNSIDDNKVSCIHCGKSISKNGGTSNLIKHVMRRHAEHDNDGELQNSRTWESLNKKIILDDHPVFHDDEKVKKFIATVQKNPILYEKIRNSDLTEDERKSCDAIWQDIAFEFEVDTMNIRNVWFTLRKQYEQCIKTKNSKQCKFYNELNFLDDIVMSKIEKVKQNNIPTEDISNQSEAKKILISVPQISDNPIHEINVSKAEYIEEDEVDEENTEVDFEVLLDYDPILVKNNQTIIETLDEDECNETEDCHYIEEEQWASQQSKEFNQTSLPAQTNKIPEPVEQYVANSSHSSNICVNNKLNHQGASKRNDIVLPKRARTVDEMDEIDLFFEFLERKLRKVSPEVCRRLQMKFMEAFQEVEEKDNQTK